ncbi:MAG: cytochrome C oxidase subunit IV family protein [Candidatus Doudnabacteria bacterium]|nr:cytochrome C oxidase subunit IV family protein [Candidatus Doudnabacteria bacterium]
MPTFKHILLGFLFSLLLTLVAFFWVVKGMPSAGLFIFVLAILQVMAQVIFFLHMRAESSQKWNNLFFISTMGVVIIVVAGCLWIMGHLNYNMMSSGMKTDHEIMEKEAIHK